MAGSSPASITSAAGTGVDLEVVERGSGAPLVVLHGASGPTPDAPFVDLLAQQNRVVVPSHPGFGRSSLPEWMDSVEDLVYVYLDLLEEYDDRAVTLVGVSLGGWVAAELAVRRPQWLGRLVLVDAVGIRVGGREDRDIADIWAVGTEELLRIGFHDPDKGRQYMSLEGKSKDQLEIVARNQESAVLFGWEPYLHNPKLRRRLDRIDVPTLVLWGASDRITHPDYGKAYAASIPGATFQLVEDAGHFPHIEQPHEFAAAVGRFADRRLPGPAGQAGGA
ncbi:MAG: alpha/beta fold hydrolase [Pseudonocardiaceae bacterium]|nr:alpha/beta fold hydrolase [Pseudonocardiaceae bacterium]